MLQSNFASCSCRGAGFRKSPSHIKQLQRGGVEELARQRIVVDVRRGMLLVRLYVLFDGFGHIIVQSRGSGGRQHDGCSE